MPPQLAPPAQLLEWSIKRGFYSLEMSHFRIPFQSSVGCQTCVPLFMRVNAGQHRRPAQRSQWAFRPLHPPPPASSPQLHLEKRVGPRHWGDWWGKTQAEQAAREAALARLPSFVGEGHARELFMELSPASRVSPEETKPRTGCSGSSEFPGWPEEQ
jgi:hypothetical protein